MTDNISTDDKLAKLFCVQVSRALLRIFSALPNKAIVTSFSKCLSYTVTNKYTGICRS